MKEDTIVTASANLLNNPKPLLGKSVKLVKLSKFVFDESQYFLAIKCDIDSSSFVKLTGIILNKNELNQKFDATFITNNSNERFVEVEVPNSKIFSIKNVNYIKK